MTRWTAFSGIVVVLLGLLLALTRSSAALVGDGPSGRLDDPSERPVDGGSNVSAAAEVDGSPRMDDDSGGRVAVLRDRLAGDEPTDPLSGPGGTERTTLSESDYPDPQDYAAGPPTERAGYDERDTGESPAVDRTGDTRDPVDTTGGDGRGGASTDASQSDDADRRAPAADDPTRASLDDDPTRASLDSDPTRSTPTDRTGPADRWRDPEDSRDRWTDDGGTPVDRWGDDDRDPEFPPNSTGESTGDREEDATASESTGDREEDATASESTRRPRTGSDERRPETSTRVPSNESRSGVDVSDGPVGSTPVSDAPVSDTPVGDGLPSDTPFGGAGPVVDGETDAFDPPIPAERDGVTVGSRQLSTRVLLLNVAGSQLLFAGLLVSAIVFAGVPAATLGLVPVATGLDLAIGVVAGIGLWVASESGGRLGQRFGIDPAEALRGALAPTTRGEWWLLLAGVLPVIALFEELLFRAVLVGAFAAGFAVPVWLLVVASSVAFGLAHSAQGTAGMVVTGLLGAVLAGVFVLTGSFLAVVVAHYLVNALEFVVHEGPASRLPAE
ncbi:type II CAAX prenyl endopeptidase Rce1 family protein [Halobaculum sp. MBLA0147]|uniref:CPBP family glutamic-type intramembrane protease n=1 Tax=Halobaculum sp. MBLA0147 TaxID=3079934 RepID=UPI003523BD63